MAYKMTFTAQFQVTHGASRVRLHEQITAALKDITNQEREDEGALSVAVSFRAKDRS